MIMVISSLICICEGVRSCWNGTFQPWSLCRGTMIYCSAFCWRDGALKWRKLPEAQLPTICLLTLFQSLTVAYFSLIWGLEGFFCPGHFGEPLQIYSNSKDTEISKGQGTVWMTGAINEKIYHPPWPLMSSKGLLLKISLGILYWLPVWCMRIFKEARNWQILQRLHKRGFKRNACLLVVFIRLDNQNVKNSISLKYCAARDSYQGGLKV